MSDAATKRAQELDRMAAYELEREWRYATQKEKQYAEPYQFHTAHLQRRRQEYAELERKLSRPQTSEGASVEHLALLIAQRPAYERIIADLEALVEQARLPYEAARREKEDLDRRLSRKNTEDKAQLEQARRESTRAPEQPVWWKGRGQV